jgi:hypothetical protein
LKEVSSKLLPFLLVLAFSGSPALAQTQNAPATGELTRLLNEFLKAASVNDRTVFEKFFADDAIYTRSAGVTITKADIMKSFDQPRASQTENQRAESDYSADQVTVHQYGDTAIVNFRLVAKPKAGGAEQHYRNTGTFVRRNGQWQAVAWQSTKAAEDSAAAAK